MLTEKTTRKSVHHALPSAEHAARHRCELGKQHRADREEPADAEDAQPGVAGVAGVPDQVPGGAQRIGVDAQISRGGRRGGTARLTRKPSTAKPMASRAASQGGTQPASSWPARMARKVPASIETGAAHDLVGPEMLRQDRIFGRAEQGRVAAHQEQGAEQQRHRFELEADEGDAHDPDLGGLDPADQPRLVDGIGDLAGERREQEIGQDEQAGGDDAEQFGLFGRGRIEAEGGEEGQGELEQIVVQRAEELDDEQGPEPACGEEREVGCGHESLSPGRRWRQRAPINAVRFEALKRIVGMSICRRIDHCSIK